METLGHLSDEELLGVLRECVADERRGQARTLFVLGEVEERRMYLAMASPSMFDFCTRRLGMSEGRAFRHIAGARLARRYPFLLDRIASGELALSTLVVIGPYLDDDNVHEILEATRGKKRILVEVYLAQRFGLAKKAPQPTYPLALDEELIALINWARDHFSNAIPGRDISAVTKRVFGELKARIEKEERAALKAPSPAKATKNIPRKNRRHVHARDNGRCTYVDPATGERCCAKAYIQQDHISGRADGGGHDVENLRLACRAHNLWFAELRYGKEYIAKRIRLRKRTPPTRDTRGDS